MAGGVISLEEYDDRLFGEPHRSTVEILRERIDRYAPRMMDSVDGFFSDVKDVFEEFNGRNALRRIRQTVRRMSSSFRRDDIRLLDTIEELQKAMPKMQMYLMANPIARELEAQQVIDAYSDSYSNPYPGKKGMSDPIFRRVMDGVVLTERYHGLGPDEDDDQWHAMQDVMADPDDEELDQIQSFDIRSSWAHLEYLLSLKKKDPTSVLNDSM